MWGKIDTMRKIYREETRFDWLIFAANAFCVLLVLAACVQARPPGPAPGIVADIAGSRY